MSTVAEWLAHPVGGPLLQAALAPPADVELDETMQAMMLGMPGQDARRLRVAGFDRDALDRLVEQVAAQA